MANLKCYCLNQGSCLDVCDLMTVYVYTIIGIKIHIKCDTKDTISYADEHSSSGGTSR